METFVLTILSLKGRFNKLINNYGIDAKEADWFLSNLSRRMQ